MALNIKRYFEAEVRRYWPLEGDGNLLMVQRLCGDG